MNLAEITILERNIKHFTSDRQNEFILHSFETKERKSVTYNSAGLYIFLQTGSLSLSTKHINLNLSSGMYCALSGQVQLEIMPNSRGIIIENENFVPLSVVGGPIESIGRLKYIDGCSDTLLISPSKLGEPCLNLLHFPKKTVQTMHHHPSFRFGIVVSGMGESVSQKRIIPLNAGDVFFIPENEDHKFNTYDCEMNVIAFHPDSDWGPTDEVHPMKNRTWFKK